jgi:2-polyprenyl-6-hydroxyphenyl methylase/3-demethylubiquinone-9 3-methyltransferase
MSAGVASEKRGTGATVDPAEVAKFAAMADSWWDPKGKFAPLHQLNPLRLRVIRDAACAAFERNPTAPRPLDGLRALDIGCGGGLVSEPLARLGATVTGIDATPPGLEAARAHAVRSDLAIDYRVGSAESLLAAGENPFDLVLALEIVEHVADPNLFLQTCAQLVAPGGVLVVSTLNRTPKAFAMAIVGAEHLMRWLPVGTHDWAKFLKPEEIAAPLTEQGLAVEPAVGMVYDPFSATWRLSRDASVNYMMTARRAAG